jgi:hypothetical protein
MSPDNSNIEKTTNKLIFRNIFAFLPEKNTVVIMFYLKQSFGNANRNYTLILTKAKEKVTERKTAPCIR